MRVRGFLGVYVAAAFGAAIASACGGSPCGPSSAMVEQVIDGDTIVLSTGDKVRYFLVDAPETTSGHNDCYGQQAATKNRELVEGKTVQLSYDSGQCKDRYGRYLAYVSVGGVDVNKTLVQGGYACFYFLAPGGQSRKEEFETYQSEARSGRIGLWSACATVTCG